MSIKEFADMALSFNGTEEHPHFDRRAFKVQGKRIFATLHEDTKTVNVKLKAIDQSTLCAFNSSVVYPVPNKWGAKGWTTFHLESTPSGLMFDALTAAYQDALAGKKRK
jgi:predicted DNA-binding protein (MmcQ/YjbR family)